MKLSTKIYRQSALWICLLSFALSGCERMQFSDDLAGFNPNNTLVQYSVNLTGAGQVSGARIVDIDQAKIYTTDEAETSAEKVDFIAMWGASSGMNFLAPLDINRLSSWGSGQTINESWLVKNATTFIKLDASYTDMFDDIQEVEDVKKAYDQASSLVTELEDYSQIVNGPNLSIRDIKQGDIVFFKTSKDVYAVAKIVEMRTGNSGGVKMSVKTDLREVQPIAPIDESERIDLYQVSLTKPAYYDGWRFLDVTTGSRYGNSDTYTELENHAFYHQENMDFIFLNGSSSGANLVALSDADQLSQWGTGEAINQDWLVKNEGTFIKLDASTEADSIFLHAYTRTKLHEAYAEAQNLVLEQSEYEEAQHGPGSSISGLQEGDLIFFESTSKHVLAMFQVTSYTSGGSGSLELATKVDNSDKVEVLPSPDALNYGNLSVGGWSALGPEGNTFHVDLASITRFDPASADVSQGSVDMLNLWSGAGYVNFMAPSNSAVTAWGSSSRIEDWEVRNDGTFIRLSNPTSEERATFDALSNRELLLQAYEEAQANIASRPDYEEDNNGPSTRVRRLAPGDIVYFKSNAAGRNLYAAIEVKDITPGSANGREVVEIYVKSNLYNEN